MCRKGENSAEPAAPANRRILTPRPEASSNGKVNGLSPTTNEYDGNSSKSDDYRDSDGEEESETLDRRYIFHSIWHLSLAPLEYMC